MNFSLELVVLLYLVASVCFIQALKGLSHPRTSRAGNVFGMVGMAIAAATTVGLILKMAPEAGVGGLAWVLAGLVVGGGIGATIAFKVEMTKMPEMVAFMHSMIGLAAVFIAIAAVAEPSAFNIVPRGLPVPVGNRVIGTRRAIVVPTAPPTTSPSSTQASPAKPVVGLIFRISPTVVTAAIAIPIMPKALPARELAGCDRPLSAWMKHTEATRYSSTTSSRLKFMYRSTARMRR